MDFTYEIKNDTYLGQKLVQERKFKTKLNPNKVIGNIDADKWDEPTIISDVNKNFKTAVIDADMDQANRYFFC